MEKGECIAVIDVIAGVLAFDLMSADDLPVGRIDSFVIIEGFKPFFVRNDDVVGFCLGVQCFGQGAVTL